MGVANVRIDYSTDNGSTWMTISSATPASAGSYTWTIQNTPASQALVRISDVSNSALNDLSNATFVILPPPAITVTSPNGGEIWDVLSSHAVTWTSVSVSNVKVQYSTDAGGTWTTMASSVPASSGSWQWTVANTPTDQARIRISD